MISHCGDREKKNNGRKIAPDLKPLYFKRSCDDFESVPKKNEIISIKV